MQVFVMKITELPDNEKCHNYSKEMGIKSYYIDSDNNYLSLTWIQLLRCKYVRIKYKIGKIQLLLYLNPGRIERR